MSDELNLVIDVVESPNIIDELGRIGNYLNSIDASLRDDQEPKYCLDWEMIHEAIYPDVSKSVYSPLLWYGLQCLEAASEKDEDWKPYLPEGTRIEMLRHLRALGAKARDQERSLSKPMHRQQRIAASDRADSMSPQWHRQDWKEVLSMIGEVYRTDDALNLLWLLLEHYCQPSPIERRELSNEDIHYFEKKLRRLREKETNRADAINLASVSMLNDNAVVAHDRRRSHKVSLVTASWTVWEIAEALTVDPFYLLLEADHRRRYKNKRVRRKSLLSLEADIFRILARLQEWTQDQRPQWLRREEVAGFLEALESLESDLALKELARLLSVATQAVNIAVQQARDMDADIRIQGFGGIGTLASTQRKVRILAGKVDSRWESNTLQWTPQEAPDVVRRATLYEGKHNLLNIEAFEDNLTLFWQTKYGLKEFQEALPILCTENDEQAQIALRLPYTPGVIRTDSTISKLLPTIKSLLNKRRFTFVRVDLRSYTAWFTPDPSRTPKNADLRYARIAVRYAKNEHLAVAEFHGATAYFWYFPEAIALKLKDFTLT